MEPINQLKEKFLKEFAESSKTLDDKVISEKEDKTCSQVSSIRMILLVSKPTTPMSKKKFMQPRWQIARAIKF